MKRAASAQKNKYFDFFVPSWENVLQLRAALSSVEKERTRESGRRGRFWEGGLAGRQAGGASRCLGLSWILRLGCCGKGGTHKGPGTGYGNCRPNLASVPRCQIETQRQGLSWWLSGKGFTYQCRRQGFDPSSGKIPHWGS